MNLPPSSGSGSEYPKRSSGRNGVEETNYLLNQFVLINTQQDRRFYPKLRFSHIWNGSHTTRVLEKISLLEHRKNVNKKFKVEKQIFPHARHFILYYCTSGYYISRISFIWNAYSFIEKSLLIVFCSSILFLFFYYIYFISHRIQKNTPFILKFY